MMHIRPNRSYTSSTLALTSILLLGLGTLTGCPEEGNNNKPIISPNNTSNNQNNQNTNNKMDMGDMDMSTTSDQGDMPDDKDTTGSDTSTDMPQTGVGTCTNLDDLGEIDTSNAGKQTFSGSNADMNGDALPNGTATSCGFGAAAEKTLKFTVSGPARIQATLTPKQAVNWSMAVHTGECDMTKELTCVNDRLTTFVADKGTTYYLVLEPTDTRITGDFDIQLDITPLVCLPVGGTTCTGSNIERCEGGGTVLKTHMCAAPCASDACGADICANALTVDTFPFTFTAPANAYFGSHVDFSSPHSCRNPDTDILEGNNMTNGTSMPTPGEDVMFKLTGLKQGQKVTIDASGDVGDTSDSAIFILDSCDDLMTCYRSRDLEDKIEDWEVPKDGDFTVIVDRRVSSPLDISVKIDVK